MRKKKWFLRLTSAVLTASLLSFPCAQALTAEQASQLLEEIYVDEVPQSILELPTIEEMLKALGDPYTEYFTPEEYAAFNATMSDSSLVGIGVVSRQTEEGLCIDTVLEDSPAEKGSMQAGDVIIEVDGHSIVGEDSDTAIARIRGEEGTTVRITYLRDGVQNTVTLTRALVVVAATTTELIDGHIGYISCTTFGGETAQHFREGIEKYKDEATVWIVDLRSNTGGTTQAAVDAAGCFTGSGPQAYLRNGADEYSSYFYQEDSLTLYPVIVLMDEYSASSSELFASAIRDYGAGIVIGTRSYGKGVAQTVLDRNYLPEYFPDGDAIKITSHRFFSPAGNSTDQVGVIPNLLVPEEMIGDVAYLLAGPNPSPDTSGTLRVDLSWRWYVDLETASEYKEVFQILLDAIPANTSLWLGSGGSDGWRKTDAVQVAESCGLEYHIPEFPDQEDSNFKTALSVLKTFSLLRGREDGLFHPQDNLTRAELCQMLAMALNCAVPVNESPYSDVASNTWYAPAVIAMTNMGLVNGVGKGQFQPQAPVDHQQLITIMGRLAQWLNLYLYDTLQEAPSADMNVVGLENYADWAKRYAWLLSYSQTGYFGNPITLLWDSAEKIDPAASTTRDEAAYTLYRILSYTDILPA